MPGTGPLRRSSRADRIKAIVGKSRIEAALRSGIQNSQKTQLLGGERRKAFTSIRKKDALSFVLLRFPLFPETSYKTAPSPIILPT